MTINKIDLLNDIKIRVGNTTLWPWPDYKVEGESPELSELLTHVLKSQDIAAVLWRAKIPQAIQAQLLSFPKELLPQLLSLSQLYPKRFEDWSEWCPSLLTLIMLIEADDERFTELERLQAMEFGWRKVLAKAGWKPTRANLNLLRKVPIECCTAVNLMELKQHVRDKRKRKLLSHVEVISNVTLDSLHLPAWMLSVRLLSFTEDTLLLLDIDSVREVCLELLRYRQELNVEPIWPYAKHPISMNALYGALQVKRMYASFERDGGIPAFPKPPLPTLRSSLIHIEPLNSISKINCEGNAMQNCLITYGQGILQGQFFAYKLLHPERATVLLMLDKSGSWVPSQIKTFKNGNPQPETVEVIEKWAGAKYGKEVADDMPF